MKLTGSSWVGEARIFLNVEREEGEYMRESKVDDSDLWPLRSIGIRKPRENVVFFRRYKAGYMF